jgi:hypothetical protein
VRIALAINDPKTLYNSLIMFYDVTFDSPGALPRYRLNQQVSMLSVNRLGIDSFKVSSLALIGNSSILALGIEDYGIMLYCMLDFSLINYVSLKERYTAATGLSRFVINAIIPQGELMMLLAIVNNHAVYSLRVDSSELGK